MNHKSTFRTKQLVPDAPAGWFVWKGTMCWLALGLVTLASCSKQSDRSAPMEATAPAGPFENSQVVLSEPNMTISPQGLLKFSIKYEFVKGSPSVNYVCYLSFPGTTNEGQKPMQAWEMQKFGRIQGAIELQSLDVPVTTFEAKLGESDNPQAGFEIISNTLTGEVTPL